ncbi:unnamed protein product [Sphagnum tenellum]
MRNARTRLLQQELSLAVLDLSRSIPAREDDEGRYPFKGDNVETEAANTAANLNAASQSPPTAYLMLTPPLTPMTTSQSSFYETTGIHQVKKSQDSFSHERSQRDLPRKGKQVWKRRAEKSFRCKQCDFACPKKKDLLLHIKQHKKAARTGKAKASKAGKARKDKANNTFQCSKCNFATKSEFYLDTHVQSHTAKSKGFSCETCDYACPTRSMLKSHLKKHSQFYPYRCLDCAHVSKYLNAFKTHLIKTAHKPGPIMKEDGTSQLVGMHGTKRGRKRHSNSHTELSSDSVSELIKVQHIGANDVAHWMKDRLIPDSQQSASISECLSAELLQSAFQPWTPPMSPSPTSLQGLMSVLSVHKEAMDATMPPPPSPDQVSEHGFSSSYDAPSVAFPYLDFFVRAQMMQQFVNTLVGEAAPTSTDPPPMVQAQDEPISQSSFLAEMLQSEVFNSDNETADEAAAIAYFRVQALRSGFASLYGDASVPRFQYPDDSEENFAAPKSNLQRNPRKSLEDVVKRCLEKRQRAESQTTDLFTSSVRNHLAQPSIKTMSHKENLEKIIGRIIKESTGFPQLKELLHPGQCSEVSLARSQNLDSADKQSFKRPKKNLESLVGGIQKKKLTVVNRASESYQFPELKLSKSFAQKSLKRMMSPREKLESIVKRCRKEQSEDMFASDLIINDSKSQDVGKETERANQLDGKSLAGTNVTSNMSQTGTNVTSISLSGHNVTSNTCQPGTNVTNYVPLSGNYLCRLCDIAFSHSAMHASHMSNHGDENPLKCNSCDQMFADKVDFFLHISGKAQCKY